MQIDPRPEGLTLTHALETLSHLERRQYTRADAPQDIAANVADGVEKRRGAVMTQQTRDIIRLSKAGVKNNEIARQLGVKDAAVCRAVKKGRAIGELKTMAQQRDEREAAVIELYKALMPRKKIAKQLGASVAYINKRVNKYMAEHEPEKFAEIKRVVNVSKKTALYVDMYRDGKRIIDIARETGEKQSIVDAAIRRARKRGDLPNLAEERNELNDKIIAMHKQGMNGKEIATALKVGYNRAKYAIRRYKKQEVE